MPRRLPTQIDEREEQGCYDKAIFKRMGSLGFLGLSYPDHGAHCARVAGTLCGGKVQGSFATKLANCMQCDFYQSPNYDKTYKG